MITYMHIYYKDPHFQHLSIQVAENDLDSLLKLAIEHVGMPTSKNIYFPDKKNKAFHIIDTADIRRIEFTNVPNI